MGDEGQGGVAHHGGQGDGVGDGLLSLDQRINQVKIFNRFHQITVILREGLIMFINLLLNRSRRLGYFYLVYREIVVSQ